MSATAPLALGAAAGGVVEAALLERVEVARAMREATGVSEAAGARVLQPKAAEHHLELPGLQHGLRSLPRGWHGRQPRFVGRLCVSNQLPASREVVLQGRCSRGQLRRDQRRRRRSRRLLLLLLGGERLVARRTGGQQRDARPADGTPFAAKQRELGSLEAHDALNAKEVWRTVRGRLERHGSRRL